MAIVNIWIERRVVGRMQSRLGPNRLGPFGLLQPIADAIKLMQKEVLQPRVADGVVFSLAPVAFTVPGIVILAVLPWGRNMTLANLDVGILFILAMSSLGALAVFMAARLEQQVRALRRDACHRDARDVRDPDRAGAVGPRDVLRHDEPVGDRALPGEVLAALLLLQPLPFIIYFISSSAELNRTPADIAEAESEIVGGYHAEYSGMKFGLFYAAELINAVAVSAIMATVFLGGWWMFGLDEMVPGWMIFIGKIYAVYFLFVWTRGTLPRFRIDQLLAFAWKWMTPMAFLNIVLVAAEVLIWDETGASAGLVLSRSTSPSTTLRRAPDLRLGAIHGAEVLAVPDASVTTRKSTCPRCRSAKSDAIDAATRSCVDRSATRDRRDGHRRRLLHLGATTVVCGIDGRCRART